MPSPDPGHAGSVTGTLLYRLPDPGPAAAAAALPPAAAAVVAAVRDGTAAGMLPPPVVAGPGSTIVPGGELRGERDARVLARAFTDPRFAPVSDLLSRLDRWCRDTAPRYATEVAPGVLTVTNPGLFGPVVTECFAACASGPADPARRLADQRGAQCEAFLELFLTRLTRDRSGGYWPPDPRLRGPVTELWAHDEETHNGGQRVLRLALAGGGRVAYKPRPASGEALFLSPDDSLFALLNRLAAGQTRLPELPSWTGAASRGPGLAGYSWQEWVEPPGWQGVLRAEDGWQLTGTVLPPPLADRFWRHTGAQAAVCYALGITDLHSGNLLVGARAGQDEPLMYPVDLEVYLAGVTRLADTHLIHDPTRSKGTHHVGLENEPYWCTLDGPSVVFRRTPGGGLELHRRNVSFGRTQTRSVVGDTAGRTGYGPYLAAMLRGMFDGWTLLARHRSTVREFLQLRLARHTVRVLPRATASYQEALRYHQEPGREDPGQAAGTGTELSPAERDQLGRGDVPYFFRAGTGGPLLATSLPPGPFQAGQVSHGPDPGEGWPPKPPLPDERLTLAGLGMALRDAAGYVIDDLPSPAGFDPDHGVRWHVLAPDAGQVSFDWPERDRRITYHWHGGTMRVRVDPLAAPVPPAPAPSAAGEIRHRLLRMDRVDRVLRHAWTASGFTDPALEAKLRRLTSTGLAWLRGVVAAHGWPGQALVGAAAAGAAGRLVQHADGEIEFRRHCLELVWQAAMIHDMPSRDVAYLTDALLLAAGKPQRYGTKFERVGDLLEPCPIEAPDGVDDRRAELGMEPLAVYTQRIRAAFPLDPAAATAKTELVNP